VHEGGFLLDCRASTESADGLEHGRPCKEAERLGLLPSMLRLNDYERTVWLYTEGLMTRIGKSAGESTNVPKLVQLYAFNVMADLAFRNSPGSLDADAIENNGGD